MEKSQASGPMGPPPLPQNWNEMTGDEKYRYLLNGWMTTEGKPFKSPEIAERYRKRAQRWADIVALKEPDEVPARLLISDFILENADLLAVDEFYQPDKFCTALLKMHADFDPDYSAMSLSSSGRAFDTLGLKLIRWPGSSLPSALPDDTSFQYVEDEYMRADEYDELINNPEGFLLRKYLPRICGNLGGLSFLANGFNFVESASITPALASLAKGTPARKAIDTLLKAADECMETMQPMFALSMRIAGEYGAPSTVGGFSFVPYDLIGDTMRCTMGIMKDLYRRPEKIIAAVQTLVPMAVDMAIQSAYASRVPFVIIPLHKGADGFMSPEQFKKFYWPTFKATLMGIIDAGLVPVPFVEGAFNQRLDIIAEDPLPKGRTVWIFDRTDMKAAKEKLGGWACIGGNVPASLYKQGSVQMLEDYCKELIETCAVGGGFFLSPGVVLQQVNPENLRAYLNCGKKFGKY